MKDLAGRIAIVVGLVVLVHAGFYVVRGATQPPDIELPNRKMSDMPVQLGQWQGGPGKLDAKIVVASEAYDAADRIYRGRTGREICMFTALYTKIVEGAYHSPTNCYRSNGWTMLDQDRVTLEAANRPETTVSLSTWEQKGERILVVYWYELGNYTLFERSDLGRVRWALRGAKTWPPMYKVLLQTPADDPEAARTQILELAGLIREWLGKPAMGDATPVAK